MGATPQANEPSMEEILNSIRKIISDDDKGEVQEAVEVQQSQEPAQDEFDKLLSENTAPQAALSEEALDDILELTEKEVLATEEEKVVDTPVVEGLGNQVDEPKSGDVAFVELEEKGEELMSFEVQGQKKPQSEAVQPSHEQALSGINEEQTKAMFAKVENEVRSSSAKLLSEPVDQAVSSAFSGLATTVLNQNARTLEDLVSEMLRPMLKDWLDQYLPVMVERLVRQEIERITTHK
ncbi:DUF2497 domain-containing protein [Polycladidibacter stylochi]|uniref:DUF2497 domain-containing protein n=1 Tax=Polycladidibacter stylochi TaxID=1807766 RepID=UPI00082FD267|nr:DUF2497 domain-containing protein [Pseudovibrio stylochi]